LADANKRKAVNLGSTDVLQAKIGRHKGPAYIHIFERRPRRFTDSPEAVAERQEEQERERREREREPKHGIFFDEDAKQE
jgi:hypothetical protein